MADLYKEKPWTKHPPFVAYGSEGKLRCSMAADWLLKYYYALANATELAALDKYPEYKHTTEAFDTFDAKAFGEHIKVILGATAEEEVDTRPYMKTAQEEAEKLIELSGKNASAEEIYSQVHKLRKTYLENAVSAICACERGDIPISDDDQMKKHGAIMESWEPSTKALLKETFGFDIRHLFPEKELIPEDE